MSSRPGRQRYAPRPGRGPRLAAIAIGIGLVLVLLWLAISAFRIFAAGRSLLEQQAQLESMLQAGILNADAGELERVALVVREDIVEIKQVAGPFAVAGRYLGWLPVLGPLAEDSQALLEMADAGSEMAIYALSGLKPILALYNDPDAQATNSLPGLITALDDAGPELLLADQAAGRLLDARGELGRVSEYPAQLAALVNRFDDNAGLLNDGLKLALITPELLGMDGPRTFLIMAQNEDELRPTGGFISGAGAITVDKGQIVSLVFEDASVVDDWDQKPYDLPPAPFTEFMGMDIFLFRDANFWPDFAASAAQAMALYTYGREVPLDGALAIDQQFLQRLLAATGPLPVPELDRIVDAQSAVAQLREEWGAGGDPSSWVSQRKAFMAPLANAFRSQLESGLLSAKGFELIQMMQLAAQERHLQLYVADPALAEQLNQTAWSGRLGPYRAGDFLHVSDTNLGFNKVNAVVDRSLSYLVTLDDEQGGLAKLQLRYQNPAAPETIACIHGTLYEPDTKYETLTSDCYWNYLRIFVPKGSVLLSASEHPLPAHSLMSGVPWPGVARVTVDEYGSFTTFDNFLLLEPGQDVLVDFEYALPDSIVQSEDGRQRYELQVRKQAGTGSLAAQITIALPDDARLLSATPQPTRVEDNLLTFDLSLASDAMINVEYR